MVGAQQRSLGLVGDLAVVVLFASTLLGALINICEVSPQSPRF